MDREPFHPDNSEIQLYGNADGRSFAFETINIAPDDALDIVEAIQWYAGYIKCPGMDIAPDDPRPGRDIAM